MNKQLNIKLLLMLMLVAPLWTLRAQNDTLMSQVTREWNWQNNARCFSKGLEQKMEGNVEAAVTSFREALNYNPNDAASMYELSDLLVRTSTPQVNEAMEMIEQAVQLDSTNKWYWLRLSKFYELNNDISNLLNAYKHILNLDPINLEIMAQLITIDVEQADFDDALVWLDKFEQLQGTIEPVVLQRVDILEQQKKKDKVIDEIKRLVDKYPNESRYLSMLANKLMEAGRDGEALAALEKVKQMNPNDPYVDVALLEYYEKKGDLDKAFDELEIAIRNPNLDYRTKAEIYNYWFADKDIPQKKINEMARRTAEAFISVYPEDQLGYTIMGSYLYNTKNFAGAAEQFAHALTYDSTSYYIWQQLLLTNNLLNTTPDSLLKIALRGMKFFPTQPLFYWYAGYSYINMNNTDVAIETFEKGRRFVGDNIMLSTFNMVIGDLYHQKQNKVKAYEAYDRAVASNPDNKEVLNNYAYFLATDSVNLDKALLMSQHAVELDPNNATFLDTYAWVLYNKANYEAAKKQIVKAIKLAKKEDAIYYTHYGYILMKLGKTKEANKYWQKAKQLEK